MSLYPLVRDAHNLLSQIGLGVAVIMLIVSIVIGLVRHGDATRSFRQATVAVLALMLVEMLLGIVMYAWGFRPAQEVHLIYGIGATLSLPFFIYVEMTARKRPAMGSYIWGFGLLAAIILRAMMTGA